MYTPQETMPGGELHQENTLPQLQHRRLARLAISGIVPMTMFFMNTLMMVPVVIGLIQRPRLLVHQDHQMYKRRPGA